MKEVRVKGIPCEVYSRVVGYYRPVQSWNVGKRQEFKERKTITTGSLASKLEGVAR